MLPQIGSEHPNMFHKPRLTMDSTSIENKRIITQAIKDLGEREIKPFMRKWDEEQYFPLPLFEKLGALGFMGILVPQQYGGAGMGYHEYVTIIKEIAKIDGGIGLSLAAHNSLCTGHILQFGNESQKMKWLPKLASGEWIGAWALTEPNTGSDAGNMRTTAKKEGENWVINGTKNFITHGKSGKLAVIMARTGSSGEPHDKSAFVVETGTEGFYAGKKEDKLGMRSSETTSVILENCIVPEGNLLGKVGEGFSQAMKVLEGGRISIAALSLGIAEGALEAAIAYSKERHQFNQPIAHFQGIAFKLADMATSLEAANMLTLNAASLKNAGKEVTKAAAMAKYYASETAVKLATEAVQIFGGYGYVKDYPVEKFYRDAKLCTIGEGTSEIQKLVISREILR